ncbi:hypothetical protein D3C87_920720 [compost metagenome]
MEVSGAAPQGVLPGQRHATNARGDLPDGTAAAAQLAACRHIQRPLAGLPHHQAASAGPCGRCARRHTASRTRHGHGADAAARKAHDARTARDLTARFDAQIPHATVTDPQRRPLVGGPGGDLSIGRSPAHGDPAFAAGVYARRAVAAAHAAAAFDAQRALAGVADIEIVEPQFRGVACGIGAMHAHIAHAVGLLRDAHIGDPDAPALFDIERALARVAHVDVGAAIAPLRVPPAHGDRAHAVGLVADVAPFGAQQGAVGDLHRARPRDTDVGHALDVPLGARSAHRHRAAAARRLADLRAIAGNRRTRRDVERARARVAHVQQASAGPGGSRTRHVDRAAASGFAADAPDRVGNARAIRDVERSLAFGTDREAAPMRPRRAGARRRHGADALGSIPEKGTAATEHLGAVLDPELALAGGADVHLVDRGQCRALSRDDHCA